MMDLVREHAFGVVTNCSRVLSSTLLQHFPHSVDLDTSWNQPCVSFPFSNSERLCPALGSNYLIKLVTPVTDWNIPFISLFVNHKMNESFQTSFVWKTALRDGGDDGGLLALL